ncbi:DUF2927 domain-containing protein [Roseovarius salinarum]|uniref:DUF2927 domain-containing protein n=1 Tax=Roseovarius salinarum TaxID=1981892 RepID=UPI001E4AEC4A|nr:DUF2927 domain-containing protein [Roseovarius salinarum]
MTDLRRITSAVAGALLALTLGACTPLTGMLGSAPEQRPPQPSATGEREDDRPSSRSRALARHYARVQEDLLAKGLLRTDGGGADTPFYDTDLQRNFERIAFYDEYARDGGLRASDGRASRLRKWARPVRMSVEFGASVPDDQRETDRRIIADYAARLSRVTGHPIRTGAGNANFHVLVMGEDDRDAAITRIKTLVPRINASSLALFRTLPRSIHCLVIAFSGGAGDYSYRKAIAFIRAEHPDLLRRSCVHEELAQGLGLANDSPEARPSIFNDDDEFALLTTHDEKLLEVLYDPRLKPGMSVEEARPIVRRILDGFSGPV